MLVWTVDPHDPYTPLEEVNQMFSPDQYEAVDTYDFEFIRKIRTGQMVLNASQIEFVKTIYAAVNKKTIRPSDQMTIHINYR